MIKKIHQKLIEKKISCVELTKTYLNLTKKLNEEFKAFVDVTYDYALNQAYEIDLKIKNNEKLNILEGVPFSLKDNISTKGLKTTCCSKILQNYIPIYDAFVWKILKKNGAVLLGKTNMDEFAMGSSCETSCYGGAKNPINSKFVPGGSSGGSASAVGLGLGLFSLGSDTGGSVRQPASYCGLIGLKPTYGAISRFGLIAFASSLDQIGILTTTAENAALVFDEIALFDNFDSTCQGSKQKTFPEINKQISGLKIGCCTQLLNWAADEVKISVENAIKQFEKMGAKIVEINLPSVDYALAVYYIIACAEASSNLGRFDGIRYGFRTNSAYCDVNDLICKTRSEGFGNEVKRRILLGTYVLSAGFYDAYYKKAQAIRNKIVDEFDEAFKNCDVIATPTAPTTAFECGKVFESATDSYKADCCTVPVNIAGLAAISIPCGFNKENLPIGLQLIGPRFSEGLLLRFAHNFEKETNNCFIRKTTEEVIF